MTLEMGCSGAVGGVPRGVEVWSGTQEVEGLSSVSLSKFSILSTTTERNGKPEC